MDSMRAEAEQLKAGILEVKRDYSSIQVELNQAEVKLAYVEKSIRDRNNVLERIVAEHQVRFVMHSNSPLCYVFPFPDACRTITRNGRRIGRSQKSSYAVQNSMPTR